MAEQPNLAYLGHGVGQFDSKTGEQIDRQMVRQLIGELIIWLFTWQNGWIDENHQIVG